MVGWSRHLVHPRSGIGGRKYHLECAQGAPRIHVAQLGGWDTEVAPEDVCVNAAGASPQRENENENAR